MSKNNKKNKAKNNGITPVQCPHNYGLGYWGDVDNHPECKNCIVHYECLAVKDIITTRCSNLHRLGKDYNKYKDCT